MAAVIWVCKTVWNLSDWRIHAGKDAEGNVYNTSYIFDREGKQIGKHRKVHLFDIDVKGGQTFKESDTLTAGDSDTVFDTEFGK